MTLRERKKPGVGGDGSVGNTPASSPSGTERSISGAKAKGRKSQSPQKQPQFIPSSVSEQNVGDDGSSEIPGAKKLPRVILRMGPPPDASAS